MSKYVELLTHPDEALAMLRFKLSGADKPPADLADAAPNLRRCYELLNATSRSFAMVIQKLDRELRVPVCLFYLVLRALDTIEDDMTLPVARKVPELLAFHERLHQRGWTFTESGPDEKDRQLLVEFDKVIAEFLALKPAYQDAIADITRRMGAGMAEFIEKRSVETKDEWDRYCHYVAGLVGIGLSRLFARSHLEDPAVEAREDLANSMGLFLQKTNIIRDYLEDINDGRIFWPRQVWQRYASALADFKKPAHRVQALACLNDLITDALRHVPDVFAYLASIRNQTVFNFCAIPQVMAIATLARCYNHHGVFTGVVKIRRGESIKLILEAQSMPATVAVFERELAVIEAKFAHVQTPTHDTATVIQQIRAKAGIPQRTPSRALAAQPRRVLDSVVPLAFAASAAYFLGMIFFQGHAHGRLPGELPLRLPALPALVALPALPSLADIKLSRS